MTMLPCPNCSSPVSSHAKACPKCGHPLMEGLAGRLKLLLAAGVLMVVAGAALTLWQAHGVQELQEDARAPALLWPSVGLTVAGVVVSAFARFSKWWKYD